MPNCLTDVAEGAPNPASYTDNKDGTITDEVTKLIWQQGVPATRYNWVKAKEYCKDLALADYNDWRLPSIIELVSVVDLSQLISTFNHTYFPSTPSDMFWSSSPFVGSSSFAWGVTFHHGYSTSVDVSILNYVRCVH